MRISTAPCFKNQENVRLCFKTANWATLATQSQHLISRNILIVGTSQLSEHLSSQNVLVVGTSQQSEHPNSRNILVVSTSQQSEHPSGWNILVVGTSQQSEHLSSQNILVVRTSQQSEHPSNQNILDQTSATIIRVFCINCLQLVKTKRRQEFSSSLYKGVEL